MRTALNRKHELPAHELLVLELQCVRGFSSRIDSTIHIFLANQRGVITPRWEGTSRILTEEARAAFNGRWMAV